MVGPILFAVSGVIGAAVAAALLTRRRDVGTLTGGALAFLAMVLAVLTASSVLNRPRSAAEAILDRMVERETR